MKEDTNTTYDGQGLKGALWTLAGTSIGAVAQQLCRGGGLGGILGGCGGGGNYSTVQGDAAMYAFAQKDAEIAYLKAKSGADEGIAGNNKDLIREWLNPISKALAQTKVNEARTEEQIKALKETTALEIQLAKQEAKCCCEKANLRIDCLEHIVNSVTKVAIPESSICKE